MDFWDLTFFFTGGSSPRGGIRFGLVLTFHWGYISFRSFKTFLPSPDTILDDTSGSARGGFTFHALCNCVAHADAQLEKADIFWQTRQQSFEQPLLKDRQEGCQRETIQAQRIFVQINVPFDGMLI